jgi:gamma-glutamylcyclotransferase (GGCT)/AIG2-like uncharacterized protein YtfP
MKLFVYGVLRAGYGPHERYMKNATFLGPGSIQGVRKSTSHFTPGSVFGVDGELYEVPDADVRAIDGYEGHPHLYERRITPIKMHTDSGEPGLTEAWVYHFPGKGNISDL